MLNLRKEVEESKEQQSDYRSSISRVSARFLDRAASVPTDSQLVNIENYKKKLLKQNLSVFFAFVFLVFYLAADSFERFYNNFYETLRLDFHYGYEKFYVLIIYIFFFYFIFFLPFSYIQRKRIKENVNISKLNIFFRIISALFILALITSAVYNLWWTVIGSCKLSGINSTFTQLYCNSYENLASQNKFFYLPLIVVIGLFIFSIRANSSLTKPK